ncbi:MAG: hypothetical protein IT262_22625 [Saprospiraceae bacterium]|nr:hypothetical protein [Saprospiraceae bacterium]
MEKKDFKTLLAKLETLAESELGQLQGGFAIIASTSYSAADKNVRCEITNNCNGGNCVSGCGTPAPAPGSGG